MEIVSSVKPIWVCLVSLLAVIPIAIFGKSPNRREAATILAGLTKFSLVLSMLPGVLAGKVYEFTFLELIEGVPLQFRVDGLGMTFALVASSLWILTSFYGMGYMRGLKEHAQTRFYCFFAISLSATLGVAFSANLLTLYVFYEMLSLATYPLVTHNQDKEARSGGRTYLTYLLSTSIGFVLPAMLFCYFKSGSSLTFTEGFEWTGVLGSTEVMILLMLFVFGFAKAGIMPFHSWLPNAMVAPTPVSALLHAVAVVKVGVFCILRVFTGIFGTEFLQTIDVAHVISLVAAFTVIVSSLIAMTQDNLKRLLAFSTIGQLSYIILGISLLAPHAVQGSMLHIPMHAFGKITLFFCAGAIFVASGKKYISQLSGLGRAMPWTMGAFAVGAMSVIGLPLTGGLLSKLYMIWGAADAQQHLLLGVYLVSSVLNGVYFFPIVYRAFFGTPSDGVSQVREAPLACVAPLVLTASVSVVLFFFPNVFFELTSLMIPSK
jgi:multicomponent Na+:H+ antiporter subunit D